jgi:hypothetical protein
MTRVVLLTIIMTGWIFVTAQKTGILHQSGYNHDYVVSSMVMFESLPDTTRSKYIATVKVTDIHNDGIIGNSLNMLKMKAKEMGANMYYVVSYTQDEKNAEVMVRLFFAGEKMLKENEDKTLKNTIFVFNQFRGKEDTAWFYMNKEKITFNQEKFYKIEAKTGQQYDLEVTPAKRGGIKILYARNKAARFIVIPATKQKIVGANATTKGVMTHVNPGMELSAFLIGFKKNQPVEIDYDLGRFLIEIYK